MEVVVENVPIIAMEEMPSFPNPAIFIDLEELCSYIKNLTIKFFDQENLENDVIHKTLNRDVQKALEDKDNIEKIKKFAYDSNILSLLIQKFYNKDQEEQSEDVLLPEEFIIGNFSIEFANEINYSNERVTSIGLIKKGTVIEANKNLFHQIHIINLSNDCLDETLRSYISEAVDPDSKFNNVREEGDKMASSLAVLELALVQLRQNIDIPHVTSPISGHVTHLISLCHAQDLNSLRNQVDHWIRELRRVAKLERNPSSGSVLQEITLWFNVEHVLLKIKEKRDTLEVALSLGILKGDTSCYASLDYDIEADLERALDMVTNYNLHAKDFPIQKLLSATTLEHISYAINLSFGHLHKVLNLGYPPSFTLRLVNSLSRDLSAQLMKVLSHNTSLLALPYKEFKKTICSASVVFSTWDDQYQMLMDLIRELNKKRIDPYNRPINLIHKKLRQRLTTLEIFRKNHEQLKAAILRMASQTTTQAGTSQQQPLDTAQPLAAEMSDDFKTLDDAFEHLKEPRTDPLNLCKATMDAWDLAVKKYEERIDAIKVLYTPHSSDRMEMDENEEEKLYNVNIQLTASQVKMIGETYKHLAPLVDATTCNVEFYDNDTSTDTAKPLINFDDEARQVSPEQNNKLYNDSYDRVKNSAFQKRLNHLYKLLPETLNNAEDGLNIRAPPLTCPSPSQDDATTPTEDEINLKDLCDLEKVVEKIRQYPFKRFDQNMISTILEHSSELSPALLIRFVLELYAKDQKDPKGVEKKWECMFRGALAQREYETQKLNRILELINSFDKQLSWYEESINCMQNEITTMLQNEKLYNEEACEMLKVLTEKLVSMKSILEGMRL